MTHTQFKTSLGKIVLFLSLPTLALGSTLNVPDLTTFSFHDSYLVPQGTLLNHSSTKTSTFTIPLLVTGGQGLDSMFIVFDLTGFLWSGPTSSHETFDSYAKITLDGTSFQTTPIDTWILGEQPAIAGFTIPFTYKIPLELTLTVEAFTYYTFSSLGSPPATQYLSGQTIHGDVVFQSLDIPDNWSARVSGVPEPSTWLMISGGLALLVLRRRILT